MKSILVLDDEGVRRRPTVKSSERQKKHFLNSLPEHRFSNTGKLGRYIDLGSRRPFTAEQVPFLLNCMREGMDYLEFAELTRRDWRSCYALYRLSMFLMA